MGVDLLRGGIEDGTRDVNSFRGEEDEVARVREEEGSRRVEDGMRDASLDRFDEEGTEEEEGSEWIDRGEAKYSSFWENPTTDLVFRGI